MPVVQSTIEAVTIYHLGATVFRTVELNSSEGRLVTSVSIPGLPLALSDATVKLRVLTIDDPNAELTASELRVGLYVAPRADLPKRPEEEEERALGKAIKEHLEKIDQLEGEIELIERMQVPERPRGEEGKPPPAAPLSARLQLESFVHERVVERTKSIRTLREALDELYRKSAELEDRSARATTARTARTDEITKTVVATLRQGERPIKHAKLQLEYFVPGARWAPAYQCRLNADGTTAGVQMRALICQRTGEDWTGVKLSLSTAAPMRWTELPELTAIRIGKAQPNLPQRRGFRPPPSGGAKLFSDFDQGKRGALSLLPRVETYSVPRLAAKRPMLSLEAHNVPVTKAPPPPPRPSLTPASPSQHTPSMPPPAMERYAAASMPDMLGAADMIGGEDFDDDDGTFVEEAQLAPVQAKMEMRRSAPRRAPKKKPKGGRGGKPGGSMPAPSAALALVFSQMTLGSPDDVQTRGKLKPSDLVEQYRATLLEGLQGTELDVPYDLLSLVESATRTAREAANLSLPKGAIDVGQASGRYDYAYEADAPVDISSDGQFHSVPLGVRESPCNMAYVVVPREDNNVYRSASMQNPLNAPLLIGPAEVYVGGEYVLTTALPEVPPGGHFSLGLGVEQGIKCARNTRFSEARTSSKVVATNRLVHEINIELRNNLGRKIECEVRERIPHPKEDAEVVVEEVKVEPAWERYDQRERGTLVLGGRRWRVQIEPHDRAELCAQYEIKIYANNELVGGNRRES